jgi:hypothetical protein
MLPRYSVPHAGGQQTNIVCIAEQVRKIGGEPRDRYPLHQGKVLYPGIRLRSEERNDYRLRCANVALR